MEEKFMKAALKEAKKAYDKLEVPVGAVIVKDGKIIARAHNLKETKFDTTKHAEILAIQKASKKLNSWRLLDCEMYVTLEPCSMCTGALINSRIKKVYIGASDEKTGAVGSVFNLLDDYTFNHKVEYEKGVLQDECESILKDFFKKLRKLKKYSKLSLIGFIAGMISGFFSTGGGLILVPAFLYFQYLPRSHLQVLQVHVRHSLRRRQALPQHQCPSDRWNLEL